MSRYIFHIDVNSAYLSWEACWRVFNGDTVDLREIPAVIGGDELSRHGIVLAKSIPAKAYGIQTGEPLVSARQKCPGLTCVRANYNLYMNSSNAMVEIIREYSPKVQRFSVDECFVDYNTLGNRQDPVTIAHEIKDRIYNELGFTVNVGISTNKILAKMASDFQKPNRVHTLYHSEVKEKMWPLPVSDLFMVGRKTHEKLDRMGIYTIGELAQADPKRLYQEMKSHGYLVHAYANGIDDSPVRKSNQEVVKGMGNSTTVKFDVTARSDVFLVLLSLAESVGMRLRAAGFCAGLVSVHIVSTKFTGGGRQRKLDVAMDSTSYIHMIAMELFDELWDGKPIRKLGLRVSDLHSNDYVQLSFLEMYNFEAMKKVDKAVDEIRGRFGMDKIYRASFIDSGHRPITGGIGEDDYPLMTSIL